MAAKVSIEISDNSHELNPGELFGIL
jgi:hypothetical protein